MTSNEVLQDEPCQEIMVSIWLDRSGPAQNRPLDSTENRDETPVAHGIEDNPYSPNDDESLKLRIDSTHRKLKPNFRPIQVGDRSL